MSTVKNPDEKKLLSLKHDRRNTYGENAKASRKLIPRGKQLSSKAARATVAQVLVNQTGPSKVLDVDAAEDLIKARTIESKRARFKKKPDASLLKVLLNKKSDMPIRTLPPATDLSPKSLDRLRKVLQNS